MLHDFLGAAWTAWGLVLIVFRRRIARGTTALWREGHMVNFRPFWREVFGAATPRPSELVTLPFVLFGLVLIAAGALVGVRVVHLCSGRGC